MLEKVVFAVMSDGRRNELSIFDDAGSTVAYSRSKKTVSQTSSTMSMASNSNGYGGCPSFRFSGKFGAPWAKEIEGPGAVRAKERGGEVEILLKRETEGECV